MVSETAFREPSILNEKKSTTNLLEPDKNFKDPDREFVDMAQVDSLTQLPNIDENSKMSLDVDNLKDDSESMTSDIELVVEESDDKETTSENEDTVIDRNVKSKLNAESKTDKEAESLKTLDDDITNTADLVRTGFSADEFNDEIDCLDAIENSSINISKDNLSNSILKSTTLNDSQKCNDSGVGFQDIEVKKDSLPKDVGHTLIKTASPKSLKVICATMAQIERNNNTTEITDKAEKGNNCSVLSESAVEKSESEEVSEKNSSAAQQSTLRESDLSETVETSSVPVKKIPIHEKSEPEVAPLEHEKKLDESNTEVVKCTTDVLPEKEMSVDSDFSTEAMSVENSVNDLEKNEKNLFENDSLKKTEKTSVDNEFLSEVSSVDDIDSDFRLKVSSDENNDELKENLTDDDVKKSTEECEGTPSSSKQNSTDNVQTSECSESVAVPENDIQKAKTNSSTSQIDSAMVVDDDKDSKSVDSTDIVIDSVESEIVELDAEDEPVVLDDDDVDERSRSQASQYRFNQLFENTAREIAHDVIGAEVVVGDEDFCATTSGMETLNSITPSDNESRKRRFEPNQDETSINDSIFVEKRAKVNDVEIDDSCSDNQTGIFSAQRKKKPLVNKARKHTSSTNAAKTVKEIEKRLQNDLDRQNRSQESSPGQDLIDEFDLEINDNDDDIIVDGNCNGAPHQNDNNSYKINLNYDVISEDNLKNIFKMMRTRLTRRQLEEIVIQKCCEMISDSNEIGSLRRQVAEMQQAEMFRKQKILNLEKQISQLRAVCQRFLEQVKENSDRQITPIKITRSVGLQVSRDSTLYNVEPNSIVPKSHEKTEKLKKLLSTPAVSKKTATPENYQSVSGSRTASPLPSTTSHRSNDPRLMNGSARINSPLSSSSSPTTPSLSPSNVGNSRNSKKIAKPTSSSASVIDLTDKDDKSENESNVATKNLLSSVNGTILTYVPVKNQDQKRQVLKPGTSILLNGQIMTVQSTAKYPQLNAHPAPVPPLPPPVMVPGAKPLPPRPMLKIDKSKSGIMLSWEFPPNSLYAEISKYQLYAYQETNFPPRSDLWKAVGDVSALPLPMACTLTQFVEGYKYHFIVRAVDIHSRCGPFSMPRTITL